MNKQTGQTELIVKQHRGELHPQIVIYADKAYKELVGTYPIPAGAIISVEEGEYATAGMLLASFHAVRLRQRILQAVYRVLRSSLKHANRKILLKLLKSTELLTSVAFKRINGLLLCVMKFLAWKKNTLFLIQNT